MSDGTKRERFGPEVSEVGFAPEARAIAFPRRVVIIMADLPNNKATTLRRASREGEPL